jgi:hypothetical protein
MRLGEGGGMTPKACYHDEQENIDNGGGKSLFYLNGNHSHKYVRLYKKQFPYQVQYPL